MEFLNTFHSYNSFSFVPTVFNNPIILMLLTFQIVQINQDLSVEAIFAESRLHLIQSVKKC